MLQKPGRAVSGVKASARRCDESLLACGQETLRTILGVTKCLAGHHDSVDPGFQLGWDVEVVHGCADDQNVGGKQLFHVLAAECQVLAERLALDRGAPKRREVLRRKLERRFVRKVVINDLDPGTARDCAATISAARVRLTELLVMLGSRCKSFMATSSVCAL